MSQTRCQLTDRTIDALKPPEHGTVTLWDSSLRGFGLRCSQGGTKTFIVMRGRRRSRIRIGRYPHLSLKDARTKAREILATPFQSGASITFKQAYELFLSTHCAHTKPRTKEEYENIIKRHFLAPLGATKLADVTTERVGRIVDGLAATPAEAFHAFGVARTLFRWAVARRYIAASPLQGLPAPRKNHPRERVLSPSEIRTVWHSSEKVGHPFGRIVQLCILLGQRRSEIGSLRWEYIDRETRTITLPATLTKNRRAHALPYGPVTDTIFLGLSRDSEFVFPGEGSEGPFNGFSKCKARLDKDCRIAPWTLHDLRRTFATQLAALGTPIHITEKLLNHVSGTISGVAAIYNRHAYLDEMRAAMERYEEHVATICTSKLA